MEIYKSNTFECKDARRWSGYAVTLTTHPDPERGEPARTYPDRVLIHPYPGCPTVELYRRDRVHKTAKATATELVYETGFALGAIAAIEKTEVAGK